MGEKKPANTEARKNEDRGLIHETMMLADWPRLPPLEGKTKRFVLHRARAPEGQDALQATKHRYAVARHLARVTKGPRKGRDFGIDSAAGKAVSFWWRTGIPLKSSGFLKLVWRVELDGSLSKGTSVVEHQPGNITRVTARRIPSEANSSLRTRIVPEQCTGTLRPWAVRLRSQPSNAVEGLKAWRPPYAYSLNKSGAVSGSGS